MKYSYFKTARDKAAPPLILAILVTFVIEMKLHNIDIQQELIWNVSIIIYAALMSLINWLKNHKNKTIKEEGQAVNPGGPSS